MTMDAGEDPEPLVSVVLPVRNEARSIDACLSSLVAQDIDPSMVEILVVDGGSEDETPKIVMRWASHDRRIRLLRNPARITPSALNIGIRAARGSVIARMDGHAEASPDYLSLGTVDLAETGAWSVGGQMLRRGWDPTARAIASVTMSPFGVGDSSHNYSRDPMWAETVFLGMWPRWVFERIGLFDEELVRNQDDELSYRIREAGGRIWFDPRIVVSYRPRSNLPGLYRQYRQYGMWKVRVLQMHPRALRWRHWVPMLWIGTLVGCTLLGFAAPEAWLVGLLAVISYVLVIGLASIRTASPEVPSWRLFATFATLHVGYGIGFWQGLVRFAPRWLSRRAGRPARLETPAS